MIRDAVYIYDDQRIESVRLHVVIDLLRGHGGLPGFDGVQENDLLAHLLLRGIARKIDLRGTEQLPLAVDPHILLVDVLLLGVRGRNKVDDVIGARAW